MASVIQIKRGTGSAIPSGLVDGELAINLDNGQLYFGSGSTSVNSFRFTNLTADNYIVSSSVTNITTQTLSGSTEFGDDSVDIHNRTGSLNISGALNLNGPVNAITVTGNINANGNIVGDDNTNITNISQIECDVIASDANSTTKFQLENTSILALVNDTDVFDVSETIFTHYIPVKFNSHITSSGNISSSGIITAEGLLISDDATITDDLTVNGSIDLEGDLDVNGTTNLDAVDIDGNVQLTGTLIVGVDDAGHDVTLFGNTSNKYIKWDASQDQLKLYDNTNLVFGTGQFNEADFDASIFWNTSDLVIDSETDIKIVADGGSVDITGHVTASGNISSSGTIFTDTLSSPGNNLSIPSNTVTITAGTAGDANLILQSDTDDSEEADNPFMLFEQDGGAIRSIIGHAGANDEYPDATVFTGGLSNHLIIAHSGSGASRGMQFGTGNNARVTINTDGEVGIGTNNPGKTLDVTGEIRASSTITATSLAINTDSEGKANIISSQAVDLKIATTHASTNRDVGIELSGSGAQYSLALDRANDTFVIAPSTVGDAPNNAKLTLNATGDLSTEGTIKAGWHGSTTRIKILVSDFIPDDIGRPAMIDDTGSDRWLESFSTGVLFASIPIPTGFKATHVHIYGSATSAVTVYEADINSKTVTSRGTGNIGTEIDITDVTSDTTNYLFLELAQASGEEVYGGYVTIAAV